jgi:hypothetical protein
LIVHPPLALPMVMVLLPLVSTTLTQVNPAPLPKEIEGTVRSSRISSSSRGTRVLVRDRPRGAAGDFRRNQLRKKEKGTRKLLSGKRAATRRQRRVRLPSTNQGNLTATAFALTQMGSSPPTGVITWVCLAFT